jgi:hypothetical protein
MTDDLLGSISERLPWDRPLDREPQLHLRLWNPASGVEVQQPERRQRSTAKGGVVEA